SIRAAHEAQVIPSIGRSSRALIPPQGISPGSVLVAVVVLTAVRVGVHVRVRGAVVVRVLVLVVVRVAVGVVVRMGGVLLAEQLVEDSQGRSLRRVRAEPSLPAPPPRAGL